MPAVKRTKKPAGSKDTSANVGYEAQLWQMADALRGSMDAAEYKHVTLGLLFLGDFPGAERGCRKAPVCLWSGLIDV